MADLDIAALRAYVEQCGPAGSYPRYATYPSFTIEQAAALLDAAEERDRLRAENERLCVHGAEPTDTEWVHLTAERDALRAQRDALLAVLQSGQSQHTHDLAVLEHEKRWVIDDVDEVRAAIRAAKGQP